MPGRDGHGPMGHGAMTGRGVGVCSGGVASAHRGTMGRGCRKGGRRGLGCTENLSYGCGSRGMKRAMRRRKQAFEQATAKEILLIQKERLEKELDAINEELDKL